MCSGARRSARSRSRCDLGRDLGGLGALDARAVSKPSGVARLAEREDLTSVGRRRSPGGARAAIALSRQLRQLVASLSRIGAPTGVGDQGRRGDPGRPVGGGDER